MKEIMFKLEKMGLKSFNIILMDFTVFLHSDIFLSFDIILSGEDEKRERETKLEEQAQRRRRRRNNKTERGGGRRCIIVIHTFIRRTVSVTYNCMFTHHRQYRREKS